MDLDSQIQLLLDNAPQDGQTPEIVAAIAPALIYFANQLSREDYYILQTLNGDWVRVTLGNRREQGVEKNVIYAFPTLQDAARGPMPVKDPNIMAAPFPVTHILFQLMALESVDSIVFFDLPGDLMQGIEVGREAFQETVRNLFSQVQQWQEGESIPNPLGNFPSGIPADFA
ncbi:MAG: hypothetical protein EA001_06490 [Oscillatoriales cyanobacterium]|jgi:hypothetical protein|nr:MAG: hypothetical protein EA001_06490 [Oscillatoriales cyanobacterium]